MCLIFALLANISVDAVAVESPVLMRNKTATRPASLSLDVDQNGYLASHMEDENEDEDDSEELGDETAESGESDVDPCKLMCECARDHCSAECSDATKCDLPCRQAIQNSQACQDIQYQHALNRGFSHAKALRRSKMSMLFKHCARQYGCEQYISMREGNQSEVQSDKSETQDSSLEESLADKRSC